MMVIISGLTLQAAKGAHAFTPGTVHVHCHIGQYGHISAVFWHTLHSLAWGRWEDFHWSPSPTGLVSPMIWGEGTWYSMLPSASEPIFTIWEQSSDYLAGCMTGDLSVGLQFWQA